MKYVKKTDGTLISSECDAVKVTENNLKKLLDNTKRAEGLFWGFTGESVDDILSYSDTSNVTNMVNAFYFCKNLKTIPLIDTSNVENFHGAFYECTNLTSIDALDLSKCTDLGDAFRSCRNLKTILIKNMNVTFSIASATKIERSDLVTVLNNLGTPTTTQTLTLGSTNLAKLTEEDIAIATQKNWTLQ